MSSANIDAYFERIGFSGSIAPELDTLTQLHALHPAAIPFENLDPLMRVPVRLDLRNLEQKLLFDMRGGYCFEQNLLFKAMLEELGYTVRALGARVLWGYPEAEAAERPVTHMPLLVEVGGGNWLADVGFGGPTPTAPLRLRAEQEQETPLETYRLLGGDPEWRLEVKIGEDWRPLYAFEAAERPIEEFVAMSDVIATGELFRDQLLVSRAERGRRLALRNLTLHSHGGGETETRRLQSVAELREVLAGPFGIELPPAERLDPALARIVEAG